MKRWLKAGMACGVALLVVAGMVSFAHAGGVINWKVKIKNASNNNVSVTLYYDIMGKEKKEHLINTGESYTFETGAKCPYSLEGWVYGAQLSMVRKCITGAASICSVACANTDWKITQHTDGAYHFDRD